MFKKLSLVFCFFYLYFVGIQLATAYPIFAQQNYKSPREANGRIVCANCHLAQKPVKLETPQTVLPKTIFEASAYIPYDQQVKQVLGNGKLGDLNVGAVLILPDGFQLASIDRVKPQTRRKVEGLYFQPYSAEQKNILVVGPVPGKRHKNLVFPIEAPDPRDGKGVHYLKYPVYFGGNRGRGQVYPDGSKSNNTVVTASISGTVKDISPGSKKGSFDILLETKAGDQIKEVVPPGPRVSVEVGQRVVADDPLTNNPNVGGFGQDEAEIVLQDPLRIQGLLLFFSTTLLTQVFLVLKKKQFEKVQLAEIKF
jgi:apocytochrome f